MTTERVIEIPWALFQLPQSGLILDVGSCDATYLDAVQQPDRYLHCLDPRDCSDSMPRDSVFHHQSLIGNTLEAGSYDAVMMISVLEHIGLPCYDQSPFADGDVLALAEVRRLLKPRAPLVVTVPAGRDKVTSWYRQYSPVSLRQLFRDWQAEFSYWGFDGRKYISVEESAVESYDYRDMPYHTGAGAGALAGIIAFT